MAANPNKTISECAFDVMKVGLPNICIESVENKLHRAQKFREYLSSKRYLTDGGQKKIVIVAHSMFGRNLTRKPDDRDPKDGFHGISLQNVEYIAVDQFLDLE